MLWWIRETESVVWQSDSEWLSENSTDAYPTVDTMCRWSGRLVHLECKGEDGVHGHV